MRRLALAVLFVVAFGAAAFAHNGALGLYEDERLMSCADSLKEFETYNLNMYYIKDQGPELGKAVEFRILSTTSAAISQPPTWSPLIVAENGNVDTGISLTSNFCMGVGETVTWIGTIPYMNIGDPDTFSVRVVADPGAYPPASTPLITKCEVGEPMASVLGGTFKFTADPKNYPVICNPGTRSESWGVIKALYR